MTEVRDNKTELSAQNFLNLDPDIFELPKKEETLAKVINTFNIVRKDLGILPVIENDGEYNKYKIEELLSDPNLKIELYTPNSNNPSIEVKDINDENTRMIYNWPGMSHECKPLKNDEGLGEYLNVLQILVSKSMEDNQA